MLVIGSQALSKWMHIAGKSFRKPTDLDVICSRQDMMTLAKKYNLNVRELAPYKWGCDNAPIYGHIEFELLEASESGRLYNELPYSGYSMLIYEGNSGDFRDFGFMAKVADLATLYSIKRSHRHYPRMFDKHIQDYHLLKSLGCGLDGLESITKIREKETEERYGRLKTPSLNKTTQDFFNDNVSNRVFIHDDMHAVMAHREKPMYEYIKIDPAKVACSKAKFLELPYVDRVSCVLEEAYVIALERCILPMMFLGGAPCTTDKAFKWALMRICTTLCSGWFRDFATENYPAIYKAYDRNFPARFLRAVDEGRIKRVTNEENRPSTGQ